MNIQKISAICCQPIPDELRAKKVLEEISKDPKAIQYVLELLDNERTKNKEVMSEMNLLLSQADTIIDTPKLNTDNFFSKKVVKFYEDNKDHNVVFHCFKTKS